MCDETISQRITELTNTILDDYSGGRTIDGACPFDQPDKKVIIDIINKLQIIVFPGHFKNNTYKVYTRRSGLSMLLEDVMFNLKKQINLVLGFDEQYASLDEQASTRRQSSHLIFSGAYQRYVNTSKPTFKRALTATLRHSTRTRSSTPTRGFTLFL